MDAGEGSKRDGSSPPFPLRVVSAESASLRRVWPVPAGFVAGILTFAASSLSGRPIASGGLVLALIGITLVLMIAPGVKLGVRSAVATARPGLLDAKIFELRARDVLAATTAGSVGGVSIAIRSRVHRGPVILEVDDEETAARVLEALGAGESGAGAGVAFRRPAPVNRAVDQLASALSVFVAFLSGLAIATRTFGRPPDLHFLVGVSVLLLVATFVYLVRFTPPEVVLGRRALEIEKGRFVPYAAIRRVSPDHRLLSLELEDGRQEHVLFPVVTREAQHFAFHLRAAALRAHGPPVLPKETPPVLVAHRPPRERIAELDATAARVGDRGYREQSLDLADVEAVLRDADQPVTVRAAAARLLVKAGRDAATVEEILETFRGDRATDRARVVAGLARADDEEAAAALEELEELARQEAEEVRARG